MSAYNKRDDSNTYSEKIKKEADINSMAVGAIISADQANDIIFKNRADLLWISHFIINIASFLKKSLL